MFEYIIYIVSILSFGIRTIIFSIGANKERKANKSDNKSEYLPFVSIIVPARNEENNIRNCILSISRNHYPIDNYEIIVVNDRSTDGTQEVLTKLGSQITNLRIINLTEPNTESNLKGKPGALDAGITQSNGEIILMTDADCTVGEKWIQTVINGYSDKEVGLIASFTNIEGKKIFDKMQAMEWIYMHTMASAGIGLNQPLGCYGNNLSIRKNLYDQMGGYKAISFSVTEDLALLQSVIASGNKVRYLTHHLSDVDTLPCLTLSEYFNQHHRWAVGGMKLGWRAAIFVMTSFALWLGIITSAIFVNPIWMIILLISRIFFDGLMIAPSLVKLRKMNLFGWIFPSVIFFTIVEAIVPFLLLNKNIKWKDQIFK